MHGIALQIATKTAQIGCAQPNGTPAMPRPARHDGLDKFQRLRVNRKAQGMKLLRIWVPDPNAPGFAEEASRQAALLRHAPEEREVLDFIETIMDADDWT